VGDTRTPPTPATFVVLRLLNFWPNSGRFPDWPKAPRNLISSSGPTPTSIRYEADAFG
jgi:hypothetical protein